jgi:hypothetical protein
MRCGPHPVNPFSAIIFEKFRSARKSGNKPHSSPVNRIVSYPMKIFVTE